MVLFAEAKGVKSVIEAAQNDRVVHFQLPESGPRGLVGIYFITVHLAQNGMKLG